VLFIPIWSVYRDPLRFRSQEAGVQVQFQAVPVTQALSGTLQYHYGDAQVDGISAEDVRGGAGGHADHPGLLQGPQGGLPAGAAAEVLPGHQEPGRLTEGIEPAGQAGEGTLGCLDGVGGEEGGRVQ